MTKFVLWITSSTPTACEILASQTGVDVVLVDGQHGAFGMDEALALVTACARGTAQCAVRVSDSRADAEICRYIDAGAEYVICPMVNTKQACLEFVSHCFYPPQGTRSYGPYRHRLGKNGKPSTFSVENANANVLPLAMIETKQAVENLRDILSVEHLSGVFIGPNDLGMSYGFAPTSSPSGKVLETIKYVLQETKKVKRIAGIFCTDSTIAKEMAHLGFDFVVFGSDIGLVVANAKQQLALAKM